MRTSMRGAVAGAAALATALLISGCGSDDGGGDDPAPAKSAGEKGDQGADDKGGSKVTPADLEGSWTTEALHADKGLLMLGISKGNVVLAGKTTCTGELSDVTDMPGLDLKCANGSTDYVTGVVESLEGKTLKIAWGSGKKSTFTKSDAVELPDMPEAPDVPELPAG